MQRWYTASLVLTVGVACGQPSALPTPAPSPSVVLAPTPAPPPVAATTVVEPPGPVAAPPVLLACEPGTNATRATGPEPTRFCARSDGTRHGPFVALFPDGTPQIAGSYKDGKLDGPWQRSYPSGKIAEQGAYIVGEKDGQWRQFGPTGAVLGEYELARGTGIERRWYDDGPLYMERTLKSGEPNGPLRVFDHSGKAVIEASQFGTRYDGLRAVGTKNSVRLEERFAHGVRQGVRQLWAFGTLLVDERYDRRGRLDGPFSSWRDRKTPRVQGAYERGQRVGMWSWFDRSNNKEREGEYRADKKVGPWFEWLENKLISSSTYSNGRLDGEFVTFDKNGNELGRLAFKDGTGTMLTFHANQQPASKQQMLRGALHGSYQELSVNGKILIDGRYANHRKHGWWREYNEQGALLLEQHWQRGKLDGVVKKYDAGRLLSVANYKNGKASGEYVEYRNDKPSLAGQFANDRRTGTWTSYDSEGSVILVATYKDGVLDGQWRQRANGEVVEGTMVAGRRSGEWKQIDRTGSVSTSTHEP